MLARLHSPRLQMMLIVALTGAVGFLASAGLLHAGVDSLWLRYLLAVAIAYLAFLFFLWCWIRFRSSDFIDAADLSSPGRGDARPWDNAFEPGGGQFGGGASASFDEAGEAASAAGDVGTLSSAAESGISDAVGGFDLEELGLVLLAIGAFAAAAAAAFWIVWAAPALLAELTLDALVAGGLYRRLRRIEGDHWLVTAMRRTVGPFVGVAVVLSLIGAGVQLYAPEAKTIGQAFRHHGR